LTIEVLIYALTRAQRHGDLSGKTYKTFSGLRGILHTESFTAGKRDWYLTFPIRTTGGALIVRIVGADGSLPDQKRFVNSIFKNISFSTVSTPSLSNDKVTISVVENNNSNDGYFYLYVAKKGNKTLWKYDSQGQIFGSPGKILLDDVSGRYVLESGNLLVVDQYGKVRKQLNSDPLYSPRSIFLKGGNLVYDTGNLPIVHYIPKRDGAQLAASLRESRRVIVYNVRTLHYEWSAAESDVGVPVSCNGQYLDTIRIVNLDECLEDGKKTPIVSIDKVNVKTGHLMSSAILSVTREEALILMEQYALGHGPNPPVKVMWTTTGVHVYGLWSGWSDKSGQSTPRKKAYTGKIKNLPHANRKIGSNV